jgi:tetrahydromethanopterin S-methyltransferase subunit D
MLKKIRSEHGYVIGLLAIIGLGFIKAVMPAYPYGATIGGIITLTLGLYGKRLIQKRPEYREKYEERE